MRAILTTVFLIAMLTPGHAAGEGIQPVQLVTRPTAGSLPSKTVLLGTQLFDGGGVTQTVSVGLTSLLDVGVSYSGAAVVGSRPVTWQPHIGGHIRVRIIEESMNAPAIAIGFDSQGDGRFIRDSGLNRFRTKSPGAYLAVSRNYLFLGDLGVHGGVNWSLEDGDGDRDPSFWAGLDKSVGNYLSFITEYDFATNDNESSEMAADRGYLNAGIACMFLNGFTIEVDLKNILRNPRRDTDGFVEDRPLPSREIRFYYRTGF